MDLPDTPQTDQDAEAQALVAKAQAWLAHDPDPHTRAQLTQWLMAGEWPTLAAAFSGRLRFGTAGLRAVMGPGPRALNNLVVRQSCLGLARVLQAEVPEAKRRGVAVGFDGRHNSRAFAEAAAGVLLAQGFVVHFFDQELPTPVVGFWVKAQKLAAGVVVTASHNPPAYNGIKVYWQDGAQIVAPQDSAIAAAIDKVAQEEAAPPCYVGTAFGRCTQLVQVGKTAQDAYLAALRTHLPVPPRPPQSAATGAGQADAARPLQVAYTPLHGVGAQLATRAVTQAGFAPLHVVQSQAAPDGNFPTVAFPNPEEAGSMDLVLALAASVPCDLALANDPDADRLAVAARDGDGVMRPLSGDELGILLADHLLGDGAPSDVVATTRASSRMLARLAAGRGVHYVETLTGFKWLARAGIAAESAGRRLVFAYEEALGYATTRLVWDKDGISALVAALRLAHALHARGETLWHQLARLQLAYGVHVTQQQTLALDEAGGAALMRTLRQNLPAQLGARQLVVHDDLLLQAGSPKSDMVLLYYAEQGADAVQARARGLRVIVRPSGTEPKLKLYYELVGEAHDLQSLAGTKRKLHAELREAMQALGAQMLRLT